MRFAGGGRLFGVVLEWRLHCLIAMWCCAFVLTDCASDVSIEVVTWYWWFCCGLGLM